MLDQYNLSLLTKKLKIAPLNIIRENMELEILNALAQSEITTKIIFYGGTALRLAFGSPRYSEDLDFLMVKNIDVKDLQSALFRLATDSGDIVIKDIKDKRNTLFSLIHIKNSTLKHPLNIKIEIAKRKNRIQYEHIPLASPCSDLKPIVPTITIESLEQLKVIAIKKRNEPRDWFDLWYITKLLKKPWKPPLEFPFDKKEFKRELKRFLPQNKWLLIDQIPL